MRCAGSYWRPMTCRSATASAGSLAKYYASGISATSTTSAWPARSPASRWVSNSPACRTRKAACSRRTSTSPRAREPQRARQPETATAGSSGTKKAANVHYQRRSTMLNSSHKTRFIAGVFVMLALSAAPAMAWEPTKPVEIVVAAGAGGASDQMARMMQAAIQKNNLMKQPMVVSLKGGASGAEALMYMKSSDGDANKVLIAYSLIYMLPLSAKIPFNWRELTPVSVVALDQFVLWDNAAGPKTVKEFIAAAKAASSPFKMGGTGSKREDNVLTVVMEQKTGAKFSYLPYKSGGEAATQLVGNHTESNVNNPSENLEVWRAGQVRALCVFDKERISYKTKVTDTQSWNDIPTCKEEGLDVQYLMLRAMFLPGKVTPEQQAFYVDLFQKVTQTAEYKEYMEKQALKPTFLTGNDMLKFLEEDDALNKSLMTEAGFVAK